MLEVFPRLSSSTMFGMLSDVSNIFAKRVLVVAFDAFTVLVCATVLACGFASPAFAYVDPSVMTYTIQALAGVAVALSAVAGVAFRRTRRTILRVLGIDENAGKEVESTIHRTDERGQAIGLACEAESGDRPAGAKGNGKTARPAAQRGEELSFKTRFVVVLVVVVALVLTVLVVPPLEVVGGNEDSLTFGLRQVWWIVALFGLAVSLLVTLLLSTLKGKAFQIGVMVLASLAVASYIQALFLNFDLPIADGVPVDWFNHKRSMALGLVVWGAIVVVPLVLSRRNRDRWVRPVAAAMAVLALVQLVGVASVFAKSSGEASDPSRVYVTSDGLLELSESGDNIVVFVLDTLDNHYVQSILSEDPSFFSPLEGFTYFDNATGSMIPTCYGVPYLLSQQLPETGEDFHEFQARRYGSATFLQDLHDAGYSVGLYTDSIYEGYCPEDVREKLYAATKNLHPVRDANVDVIGTLVALEQLGLYRNSPWIAKPLFWFFTSDLNNRMIRVPEGTDLSNTQYILDDHRHLEEVRTRGLSLSDNEGKGSFRFIHLMGAHAPYNLDADGNASALPTTVEDQTKGSMRMVYAYLDEMRRLGVYDDATIIVTTDHGFYEVAEPIGPSTPIAIFAKPGARSSSRIDAENQESTYAPEWGLKVCDMPVSHADFQASVLAAADADYFAYGQTMFEIRDSDRVRYYINTLAYNNVDHDLVEYRITGDANDRANWEQTGRTWTKRIW